ncbi:hypothetical protein BpHYR1_028721, partial [Brachionus plicatilis]
IQLFLELEKFRRNNKNKFALENYAKNQWNFCVLDIVVASWCAVHNSMTGLGSITRLSEKISSVGFLALNFLGDNYQILPAYSLAQLEPEHQPGCQLAN